MAFDPSKISIRKIPRAKDTDPEKIFESLTLRGTVENLWSPQAAALGEWHRQRSAADAMIEMNTGGGKTLVGLLIAQSLVNETGKKVLYVCPTRQLVEQAAVKAAECGIEVATYMTGVWNQREVSEESRGPCLTNYAAVPQRRRSAGLGEGIDRFAQGVHHRAVNEGILGVERRCDVVRRRGRTGGHSGVCRRQRA